MAVAPNFVGSPNVGVASFVAADSTNTKTIFTAGTNGSRISAIAVSGNNSTTVLVRLYYVIGGIEYLISEASLPASADASSFAFTSLMDADQVVWLDRQEPTMPSIPGGALLRVAMSAAIAAGRRVDVVAFGGDH